ncbi:radical SAM protein [Peredibacter sp. HCB2-198]|uniref:radical SAM protein n=1 Tax=Peredibacter sp. HCB2-198 TaxID=3383025 RepID=UPI0038B51031
MSIALSEQCNLNCTYCNVDKLSKKRIDPELFLQQYRKKKSEYPNERFQIDFFGGEPLLQWDLVQRITEEIKKDGNQLFMPTNGLLLNEERVDYLVKNNFRVSLSFDGLWQDLNRPQHNSTGSLKHYIEKRDLFKKIPDLECHTMVSRGNYNLLENHLFITELLGINPDLTLVRDVGIWDQEAVQKFNIGFSELVNWYIANADSVEVPGLIHHYLYHIILYTSKRVRVDFCGAGDHYFSFSENKLIPCNRFKDDNSMIAKIPEYKLMKECESCDVKNYCKKGCLFENIKNEGPIVELCDIYKHIYSELIRMVKELNGNSTFREYMQREIYDA